LIPEFNANIHRERSIQDKFLEMALPYLDRIGYVERYAYFQPSTGTGNFYDDQRRLTSTGLIYKNHVSTPYYTPGTLPSPWQTIDIGNYKAPGTALYGNGVYTVCSSGHGIWNTNDELHYVYQPVTGDGEILVQVNSMLNTHESAKAGLMVRQTLVTDSRHAMMVMTPKEGAKFQYRTTNEKTSSSSIQSGYEPPYWVKLVRSGNTFTGYRSANGTSWTQVGFCNIVMDETVYVGMCVAAHNNHASFCDATFSKLRLSWPKSAGYQ
jgi:regulation of enolase protein 1 (concanavalin A-like superfamily)